MGYYLQSVFGTSPVDLKKINDNFESVWAKIEEKQQANPATNLKVKTFDLNFIGVAATKEIAIPTEFKNPEIFWQISNFNNKSGKMKVVNKLMITAIKQPKKFVINYDIDLFRLKATLNSNNYIDITGVSDSSNFELTLKVIMIDS